MKLLAEIKDEVTRLAQVLGASGNDLPTYGHTRDSAHPHIEVDDQSYHYVIVERGQELERKSTSDFDELLYWVFEDTTHNLAFAYELKNRIEDQDCRRIAFPKQVELLGLISPHMAARQANEIEKILAVAPYDDEPTRAVNRMLRSQKK
jgi:hypothetical protein